ncbi:uncharacterized protein LOC122296752 [Carya illinoinensis]|uniref:uncharacterized protein LOC122296752 n=1 Tax=Carya illinoinensis TaxID=32201 RepID=UPI001C727C79|nr:uncharacterized protein LOC122296752 [Carya illinoinensis]
MVIETVEIPTMGIEVVEVKPGAPGWALDIIKYIDANEVHDDTWEARKIKNTAARYTIVKGILYRMRYSTPLLRCIPFKEAQFVLAGVHERICGDHLGGQVLENKVMRAGNCLQRALEDSKEYVRKYKKCQKYSRMSHHLPNELTSITLP